MALGPAGPLDHLPGELQPRRKSYARGWLRAPPRPLLLSPRRSPRCHFRLITTAQSLWEFLSNGSSLLLVTHRLHLRSQLLKCGSLTRVGRRSCRPTFYRATPHKCPSLSDTQEMAGKNDNYIQPTRTWSYSSVTRHHCQQV